MRSGRRPRHQRGPPTPTVHSVLTMTAVRYGATPNQAVHLMAARTVTPDRATHEAGARVPGGQLERERVRLSGSTTGPRKPIEVMAS